MIAARNLKHRRWRARTLVIAALGVAVVLVGGRVALATIPDGGGVIHGCYGKSSGVLRVIDDADTTCTAGETPLTWNQTGQQGPQGPQGATGATGPQGLPGPNAYFGRETVMESLFLRPLEKAGAVAMCPVGKFPTGGGVKTGGTLAPEAGNILDSYPVDSTSLGAWVGRVYNPSFDTPLDVTVFAICIPR